MIFRGSRCRRCAWSLLFCLAAGADGWADEAISTDWQGVERIVAVGDLHGDFEQYRKVLQDAGLVNARGRWTGDKAHLVQTGDIVDRGPASRAIIDDLRDLARQAHRKGGAVHTLIGNHEAMNSYGDLRYVHEGEYQAFTEPRSGALRERQWAYTLEQYRQQKPEEFAALDLAQFRADWELRFPLGWVEHRTAWMPQGEYGQWLLQNPVAIRINDTLFVHGGFSAKYCNLSLEAMTRRAHEELTQFDPAQPGMIEDPEGPLWYRGLAQDDEIQLRPVVDAILARYEAARIVIGHTPTGGVVWPRFDGRVVANDTGIAAFYGSNDGFLELTPAGAVAGYGPQRLPLPSGAGEREAYLRAVMALKPDNEKLRQRLQWLINPPPAGTPEPAEDDVQPRVVDPEVFSPGICR